MPTKAERYAQMADKVATQLTGSWQEWAGFLTTASRLYKYPFHEQLMIYAQRPDATACAEYDLWNEKMGRYVRRGSKGIALVDDSGDRPPCAMSLTFPTPEPVNIPALPGYGSWRSAIWIRCRPCWSASTMSMVMTLPDSSLR